jgi:uncharacterized protein (DUF427 family)
VEHVDRRVQIVLGGAEILDTADVVRVLETSHPPVYYVPIAAFADRALTAGQGASFCEYKGAARYLDVHGGGVTRAAAAWNYPRPSAGYEVLADRVAVYAAAMDRCLLDDVEVTPQPGGFYGGWVTPEIVGPIKGVPGSQAW